MNLFESLDVNVAFYIFSAGCWQNGKRMTFFSKIDTFIYQTHADLPLKASLYSHLPESRIIFTRLESILSFLFALHVHVLVAFLLGFLIELAF